jgi:hypothetical protein
LVEKIMRKIDGTSQTHTLAKEVEEFAPTHKTNVLHPYVKTLVFDSLEIPQGEGVVVAIGEENCAERVPVARAEDIGSGIVGNVAVAAVMVVPILACHKKRDGE